MLYHTTRRGYLSGRVSQSDLQTTFLTRNISTTVLRPYSQQGKSLIVNSCSVMPAGPSFLERVLYSGEVQSSPPSLSRVSYVGFGITSSAGLLDSHPSV